MIAPIPLDLADEAIARSVLALQRDAYAVEAALIGSDAIPALTESLEALREAGETWLGAVDAGGLVGALSWKVTEDGTIDIHRLVVAPRAFRRGVAGALFDALERDLPKRRIVVSTGSANEPALSFYRGRGFRVVGRREVVAGLSVTGLERPARGAG